MIKGKIGKSYFAYVSILVLILFSPLTSSGYEKEIKIMAAALSENIIAAGKKTVAVVDFTDLLGNVTELGRFFAEEFSVSLASAGKGFEVIDRTHLKTLLAEHKLSTTGLIDPQTARKLGQIAGVEVLITGSITSFGESVRLTAKVLDINTAKIIGASSGDIPKTKAIEDLLSKEIGGSMPKEQSKPSESNISESMRQVTQSKQKVYGDGFTFELQQCKMSGTRLICTILITNTEQDKELLLNYFDTRIVDNSGNVFRPSRIQLGDRWGDGNVWTVLANGIPMKAIITFDLSIEINTIALLEMPCGEPSVFRARGFKVQFRNIPITR
jgi:TolB-like protein